MRRLLALLLLPLFVLTACGDGSSTPDEEPSAAPITDIADLDVEGEFSEAAMVSVEGGFETESSASRVVIEGTGAPVQADQAVRLDFAIFDAATGEAGTSTFEQGAQNLILILSPQAVIQPFVDALTGVAAGSRIVLAVPPSDAGEGATQTETAIFVLDIEASFPGRAMGTPVAPPAGLPTVALGDLGKPTITMPAADPPAALLIQQLIAGAGPAVVAGQTVTAMYTGLKWDGTQFDSSWDRLDPREFPIGTGSVIPGWDVALVGQPVGSQILMVVPPADGYGDTGNEQAGITGTDTLVFVVDILAAQDAPAPDAAPEPTP